MNKKILIGVIAVVLAGGGAGAWYYFGGERGSEAKPQVSSGIPKTVKGLLSKNDYGQYIIVSTESERSYYVKNYSDSKVKAALEPLVGKEVEIYGSVANQNTGDLLLLWVNGKKIIEEAEAESQSSGIGLSFAEMYKTLSPAVKDCLTKAWGNARVQEFFNNPSAFPTQEESNKFNACQSNP
ncbi:hypothetical protein HYT45_00910 [Candidatus Uhrbacteria bacterium]|nr:hypothetical protein [Candidatus Uhrbacteria bacterium]